MKSDELSAGFKVDAGRDRFGEAVTLGGEPNHCKLSSRDTGGAMCAFEFTGYSGGPRHLHLDQDEWIYVIEGDFKFEIGEQRLRVGPGESVFLPRNVPHAWACVSDRPGKILDVYQPAGKMEDFFRAVGSSKNLPTKEQALNNTYTEEQKSAVHALFNAHGMKLVPPVMMAE